MRKDQILPLLLAAAMLLAPLSGCSDLEDPGAAPVTLNVVTPYGGDDGNRKNYESAVWTYEEATGNKVHDASATSNEEWKAKVLTDFEAGAEPDVLFFFLDADAAPFIQAGKVVDIPTIREEYPEYADGLWDPIMASVTDGRRYAVPTTSFWEGLFVNVKVLDCCGVAFPGPDYTWGQFLQDCQRIKDCGRIPIACSLFEVPHYWFEFCVMNNGSLANHLDVPVSANDAAGQKWAAALNDMKYLYEQGFFPDNTLTATDAETAQLFGDGEAAFLLDGSWKVSYFMENYPGQLSDYAVTYVPAKGERLASEAIGGVSMGYFITAKAWNDPAKREAAVRFVEHMTSDEVLSTFVTTNIPLGGNGSPALSVLQQSAASTAASLTGVVGAVQDTLNKACKADLFANIQNVATGAMTAEEAVASAIALN